MIDINNESDVEVDIDLVLRLLQHDLQALHVSPDAELAVVFVDEGAMEQLHVQWMDEPGPTDVLSFPMDELRPGTADRPTPPGLLGDIVVCPQVAEVQAQTAGHTMMDEIALLTTHGLLHLLGYDHALPEEERRMFGLQRELLASFAARERRNRRQ
ncbi:MAG TPA: rRNA maturation RNase YbeY [Candidatus Microbacterium pullistercoris]|nr:rRNA maturation RNase YbeY [Candidatus Microbacterium pullistercoris]